MKVKIVSVGRIKEKYYTEAAEEYIKRLSRFCSLEFAVVSECTEKTQRPSSATIQTMLDSEAKEIEKRLEGYVIVCDKEGQMLSSEQLSAKLSKEKLTNSTFSFVLGGSYGLSQKIKDSANLVFSFGNITLAHSLAQVVLLEQLYRAFMIESNGNYHK